MDLQGEKNPNYSPSSNSNVNYFSFEAQQLANRSKNNNNYNNSTAENVNTNSNKTHSNLKIEKFGTINSANQSGLFQSELTEHMNQSQPSRFKNNNDMENTRRSSSQGMVTIEHNYSSQSSVAFQPEMSSEKKWLIFVSSLLIIETVAFVIYLFETLGK